MKFEFSFPLSMLKFRRPAEWMYDFGKRHKKVFGALGDVSIAVGILGMAIASWMMISGVGDVFMGGPAQVGLVLPGVRIPGSPVFLPFFEGVVAILLLAVFHEGMHGLVASAEGLRPKYTALLLLLFLPAAAVELDEKKLAKKSPRARMRIFSAGSLGNFILAILCLGLLIPAGRISDSFVVEDGLKVLNTTNLPFEIGEVITEVNGVPTPGVSSLIGMMDSIGPGGEVNVTTANRTIQGRLNAESRLGVWLEPQFHFSSPLGKILSFVVRVLLISVQINLGVGLINLLPVGILDGGRMMAILDSRRYKIIGLAAGILLVLNVVGPYLF